MDFGHFQGEREVDYHQENRDDGYTWKPGEICLFEVKEDQSGPDWVRP